MSKRKYSCEDFSDSSEKAINMPKLHEIEESVGVAVGMHGMHSTSDVFNQSPVKKGITFGYKLTDKKPNRTS